MVLDIHTTQPTGFALFSLRDMTHEKTAYTHIKPFLEYMIACIAMIVLSPLLLAVACVVRISSPGPVLYIQNRSGYRGRIFRLYKFRTMHHHMCDNGQVQATANDKRITRVGRFLRASSIDELPQLFNVLKGDMNLIGPRPHAVPMDHDYAPYIAHYWLRYNQKPGLTGWAQINDLRGETQTIEHMHSRVSFDIAYHYSKNFLLDSYIVYKTILLMLRIR